MTDEQKAWIDKSPYWRLLERWRRAPLGDPMFVGPAGQYYAEVMARKKRELGDDGHVAASKSIGWEQPG